eukprot:CAMPEP_0201535462 /NCGR_PEP_ID=MMETSP0161_2-20130828/59089_1 /ASSEMBLY_ACC=CAM_ASM_000251 /TAXON_ID=180227 /ORGANISM="Neoparamoeba aestuarina, Strain SoJaBio B1-5/56/2" /LENGTH=225 /DNA_ID=CAMNT_0047940643 /DNA_START=233 /DNA_END=907 /DNA_ORIENTATION=+
MIDEMQMSKHIHCINVIEKLSGGNKRRLNGLIALLSTQVWLLDEPSAGLDPIGRRKYWNLISRLRDSNPRHSNIEENDHIVTFPNSLPTLVLATHHMEEVEAICTRVMIIDKNLSKSPAENSNVLADGPLVAVKEQLGAGYEVVMRLDDKTGDISDTLDRSSLLRVLTNALLGNDGMDEQKSIHDLVIPLENRIGLYKVKVRTVEYSIPLSRLFTVMMQLVSASP